MRENAGYTIIATVPITDDEEIVIGKTLMNIGDEEIEEYVCWYYNRINNMYYWGIYTDTYGKALLALFKRARSFYSLEV